MDWRATLAWARVVRQLAETLRLVEAYCAAHPSRLEQATRRATPASPTWVQPSVSATPSKVPGIADASWWTSQMAPPTPFKSAKRFLKDLAGHTAPLESIPVAQPEPNILFRLGAGPMSSIGDAFVRKFGNVPALAYSTSAPTVASASRSHPSNVFELPAVAWSPSAHAARPVTSAPRREVPSRQVGRTVEEFLDNGATCRAESAPADGGVVLAKSVARGLAIKQRQWLGMHKSIVAAPARRVSPPSALPPLALLASTPIARISRPMESAASAREVPLRLAGRVQEVLDSRRVETALADGRDPVRGSDIELEDSMGTHRCASPSTSPDWRATVRAPSSSPSSRPSTADSFISWRSTRSTSPASTASSWRPRRLGIQAQKIESDSDGAHGVEQESCSPARRDSTASGNFGGLDEEARRAQRRDVDESRLSAASRASVDTGHIEKGVVPSIPAPERARDLANVEAVRVLHSELSATDAAATVCSRNTDAVAHHDSGKEATSMQESELRDDLHENLVLTANSSTKNSVLLANRAHENPQESAEHAEPLARTITQTHFSDVKRVYGAHSESASTEPGGLQEGQSRSSLRQGSTRTFGTITSFGSNEVFESEDPHEVDTLEGEADPRIGSEEHAENPDRVSVDSGGRDASTSDPIAALHPRGTEGRRCTHLRDVHQSRQRYILSQPPMQNAHLLRSGS
ncbi:hypothetical protein B0H11DRAFT_1917451 [Mycena galericulata]|nr:hypothetical protein B0H11DRAFT_1917451 [Mycena galericulata]